MRIAVLGTGVVGSDVLDLGGISAARGTEQWLLLWLRVMGALGSARFNLRIARPSD